MITITKDLDMKILAVEARARNVLDLVEQINRGVRISNAVVEDLSAAVADLAEREWELEGEVAVRETMAKFYKILSPEADMKRP